jgi:hypothetical protein
MEASAMTFSGPAKPIAGPDVGISAPGKGIAASAIDFLAVPKRMAAPAIEVVVGRGVLTAPGRDQPASKLSRLTPAW